MITLGLDPSLTGFGWCIHDSSQTGPARVIAKGRFTTSPRQVFVTRHMWLRDQVGIILDANPQIEALGVESSVFGADFSEGAYGLFLYVNEAIYQRRKDVVYFDPSRVKLLAKEDKTFHPGKMFKQDMVRAAREDTGIRGRFNHDEADAYHVARFAARFWEFLAGHIPKEDLTPSELHVFTGQHTFRKGVKAGRTVFSGVSFKEDDRFHRFSKIPPTEKLNDTPPSYSRKDRVEGRRKVNP